MVLTAQEISKKFGSLTAVNHLSLSLGPGDCLALLGPNGAGKTTTVEMLCGLQTPDSGQIQLFGENLAQNRQDIMQKVGLVLQETNLYKKLQVRETLELFASFFKDWESPDTILERLKLTDKAQNRLEQLSGGQKQRVYLGCGIINKPKLIFLDEPTTGLDPQARHLIWDFIRDLKSQGCAVVLTTHYMEEAETLADHVAIIDHGKIIAEGTPKALIEEHCGEEILRFTTSQTPSQAWIEQLQKKLTWIKNPKLLGEGYEITVNQAATHIAALVESLRSEDLSLTGIEMRAASLEDVFLTLTGRSIRDD